MSRNKLLPNVKQLHLATIPDWLGSGLIHLLVVVVILKVGYLPAKKTEIVWMSLNAAILQAPMPAAVPQEPIGELEQKDPEAPASASSVVKTDDADTPIKSEKQTTIQEFTIQPSVMQPKPSIPVKISKLSKVKKKINLIDSVNTSSKARFTAEVTTRLPSIPLAKEEKSLAVETIKTIETPVAAQAEYLQVNFQGIRSKVSENIRYPVMARRQGWQGQVQIKFIILLSGEVDDLQILSSSGYPLLDREALQAIKTSAPFPAPPVVANLTIPVTFELN